MTFPPMDTSGHVRPTPLTVAIRREILSVLAESDTMTVPVATAQVAAGWGARRRRRGDSPPSVQTAEAIVFQVGADLVDEIEAEPLPQPVPSDSCRPRNER
jgi:hypothetical protein